MTRWLRWPITFVLCVAFNVVLDVYNVSWWRSLIAFTCVWNASFIANRGYAEKT